MTLQVADAASHRRDQIANLAEGLRRRRASQPLVKAVYFGKKREKSVPFLAKKLGISTKRVTEIAKPLINWMFGRERAREDGKIVTFYVKDNFVRDNLREIFSIARDRKKFDAYHTKTNPKSSSHTQRITLKVSTRPRVRSVTIDDVKEFAKVRRSRKSSKNSLPDRLPEKSLKKGIIRILGECIDPKDWGGESNDIFTTRITVGGSRRRAAFALKGPAKKGPLVPKMMGANGDQIQRLFSSPAQVFFVQYEGEIKESIVYQMSQLALAKAVTEGEVFYGVIDGQDSVRLRTAYASKFPK